jgi:YVTN family beta-propeller protein
MTETAFAFACLLLCSAQSLAQNAYITNIGDNTVSVINTATNKVTATIPVGRGPVGVAVTRNGSKVYVTNANEPDIGTVSVIDTATNTVTATIFVGSPAGVAVTPDGSKVYVTNDGDDTVSVVDGQRIR